MLKRRDVLAAGFLMPMATEAMSATARGELDPLVGAWSLIDAMTVAKDSSSGLWNGKPRPYSGLIIYQPNGTMAVQIASARAALPEGEDFAKLPTERRLAYLDSYYAYYGRYSFDAGASIVTHAVESSLDPAEIGIVYRRKVSLAGDVVTLTTIPKAGADSHNVLSWRRVQGPGCSGC